jgi:hypothetical protein
MYLSHIFPLAETNKFYDCDDLEDSIFYKKTRKKAKKYIFLKSYRQFDRHPHAKSSQEQERVVLLYRLHRHIDQTAIRCAGAVSP